jgi:hypothetical protein
MMYLKVIEFRTPVSAFDALSAQLELELRGSRQADKTRKTAVSMRMLLTTAGIEPAGSTCIHRT